MLASFTDVGVTLRQDHGAVAPLFSSLSFDIGDSDRMAVLGPNGCGKTTVLNLIDGTRSPSSGRVTVSIDRAKIAYMPQDYRTALFPWLRFDQNCEIYAGNPSGFDRSLFAAGVERFKVAHLRRRRAAYMSGGEQQLLVLSAIMACDAKLYLLDEPFASVDLGRRRQAIEFVGIRLRERRAAALLVTHNVTDAAELTDRALVISGASSDRGRMITRGSETDFEGAIRAAVRT